MNSIALSIGLSALSGFGDVEFHGVGQTAVSVVDDVETLEVSRGSKTQKAKIGSPWQGSPPEFRNLCWIK